MRDLRERFALMMAETLRCSGLPEWQQKPLFEVNAHLVEFAERERTLFDGSITQDEKRELEQARFAVVAWADERMLASARSDAAAWAAVSLQYRYFSTAEAGRLFYQELEKCLDARGVPRRVRIYGGEEEEKESGGFDLNLSPEPEREEWRALTLAERLEAAASAHSAGEGEGALGIFALCLLYGFKGSLYNEYAELSRMRKACLAFFDTPPVLGLPPQRAGSSELLAWAERASYILAPVLLCMLFAFYCAGVLANTPFRGSF